MITMQRHIIAKLYVNILTDKSIPWYKLCFSSGDGIFQEDEVPVHTVHILQD